MTDLQNLTEKNLTAKQKKAIPIIISASSISEGCKKVGISRDTFYTWMQTASFRDEFLRQRAVVTDEALHTLKASLAEAIETLKGLLKAEGARGEGTKLKASLAIIENVLKSIEIENIETRLADLEKRLKK